MLTWQILLWGPPGQRGKKGQNWKSGSENLKDLRMTGLEKGRRVESRDSKQVARFQYDWPPHRHLRDSNFSCKELIIIKIII